MGEEAVHVAMLPWLAFGHMIPFFHLAIALATAGLRISFLSTPRNIRRLPKVPNHLTSRINFIELPLLPVDGLPDHAESTVDMSLEETQYLKKAYDLLTNPIKHFLAEESPDWILHDFVPHWIVTIARECGIPCIFFSVYSAAVLAFFGPPESFTEDGRRRWWPSPDSMTLKPEWVSFPSTVAFRPREAEGFYRGAFDVNASGVSDVNRFRLTVEGCEAVAVRSCTEYEGEYLELLGSLYRKPVIPIGLLLPKMTPEKREAGGDGHGRIFEWLDRQEPKSVVFVCFGSEYKLTENEVHELAHGMDLSKLPFLWALRRPVWVTGEDKEALPEGFTGRTKGRGLVTFGWAPQLEILAHPSIGGSLFHSGWGSIVETLRYGHALVLLPSVFDQGLIARLLVEKGLAMEVERCEDGSFNRYEIAKCLTTTMISNEGEMLRLKAREMAATFADEALHDQYVRRFIEFLLKDCNKSGFPKLTNKTESTS